MAGKSVGRGRRDRICKGLSLADNFRNLFSNESNESVGAKPLGSRAVFDAEFHRAASICFDGRCSYAGKTSRDDLGVALVGARTGIPLSLPASAVPVGACLNNAV